MRTTMGKFLPTAMLLLLLGVNILAIVESRPQEDGLTSQTDSELIKMITRLTSKQVKVSEGFPEKELDKMLSSLVKKHHVAKPEGQCSEDARCEDYIARYPYLCDYPEWSKRCPGTCGMCKTVAKPEGQCSEDARCVDYIAYNPDRCDYPNVATTCPASCNMCKTDLNRDPKEPLLLTPLISSGDIETAQTLSRVDEPSIYNGTSYAGYLTADEELGNHLFFWFFPSMDNPDAPVLIWLNGGPGVSSLQGLFQENGPVEVDQDEYRNTGHVHLVPRKSSWVGPFSMVYIDNPVGVGFSYSDSGDKGLRNTREEYSGDLYSVLKQFYRLFPKYLQPDLYIGGQSYAGKYVTAFANMVHEGKSSSEVEIPLRGIYLGGPYIYPEVQAYASFEFAKALGWFSEADYLAQKNSIEDLFKNFKAGELYDISKVFSCVFQGIDCKLCLLNNDNFVTGNYLNHTFFKDRTFKSKLAAAVHAGDRLFDPTIRAYQNIFIHHDFLLSTDAMMATLMNNYKVLVFNGDLDYITNSASVEAALLATSWDGRGEYRRATRSPWKVGDKLGGFYSRTEDFCRVVVHGAGHQVPTDQPELALDMMVKFVEHGCLG